ncbi:hypothetical protein AA16373_2760 [Komagataeibacter swingsii DSM 16373]|nr:hypothetical protein AA16373_2760 [Komagataeibacter swingsii DSM 16373]
MHEQCLHGMRIVRIFHNRRNDCGGKNGFTRGLRRAVTTQGIKSNRFIATGKPTGGSKTFKQPWRGLKWSLGLSGHYHPGGEMATHLA